MSSKLAAEFQSTTLHLMYYCEEIATPLEMDCVIFADTGAESKPLYNHVELLHSFAGPCNYTAKRGDLGRDLLANPQLLDGLPAHSPETPAPPCQLTKEYKLEPVIQEIRRNAGTPKAVSNFPIGGFTSLFILLSPMTNASARN